MPQDDGVIINDDGELFRYPTAEAQKIVSAVALEALDRMIHEFGQSNPVLKV